MLAVVISVGDHVPIVVTELKALDQLRIDAHQISLQTENDEMYVEQDSRALTGREVSLIWWYHFSLWPLLLVASVVREGSSPCRVYER